VDPTAGLDTVARKKSYPCNRGEVNPGRPAHSLAVVAVKVKFSCALTEHHAMKAYWGVEVYSFIHFLSSALDGGEWSASRPGRFTPRERAPGTH
jgi:hypothetical protein